MPAALTRLFADRLLAREGIPGVSRHLTQLRVNERADPAVLERHQLERLRALLVHARDNCRFYTERFAACGLVPEDVGSVADLAVVPPLTKFDIRDRLPDLIAANIPADRLQVSWSGGTTGHVTEFRFDQDCFAIKEAGTFRFEQWAGWDFGDWMGAVWPAVMDHPTIDNWRSRLRNRLVRRFLVMPYLEEDPVQIREFMAEMVRRKAKLIRAFPGVLMSVARIVEEERLPLPPLRSIISTGELLSPEMRRTFERAFACPVIDSYRSRETGPVAQQCEEIGGMHVAVDLCVLEIDTSRGYPPTAGKLDYGPILITDLYNYGMPMIRYELGDLGALDPEPCPCGRTLPLMRDVGGRLTDILFTEDRRPLAAVGLLPNFINHAGDRGQQVQVVQRGYRDLLLRMTPPHMDDAKTAFMRERTAEVFGPNVELSIEYVDEIPLLASGKYRILHCEIPQEERP